MNEVPSSTRPRGVSVTSSVEGDTDNLPGKECSSKQMVETVYSQLVACVGGKTHVAETWIFESIDKSTIDSDGSKVLE
jgi:hypothetical protein